MIFGSFLVKTVAIHLVIFNIVICSEVSSSKYLERNHKRLKSVYTKTDFNQNYSDSRPDQPKPWHYNTLKIGNLLFWMDIWDRTFGGGHLFSPPTFKLFVKILWMLEVDTCWRWTFGIVKFRVEWCILTYDSCSIAVRVLFFPIYKVEGFNLFR